MGGAGVPGSAKPDNVRSINSGPEAPDPALRCLVLEELGRIVQSPHFRHSQQSQRLLRHLVERSLAGRFEELKERLIAVELFGRDPAFDPNEDPIVRVRAAEVRKRLSRYYEGLEAAPPVKLELPTGAYRVEFRRAPADAGAPAEVKRPRLRRFILAHKPAAAAVLLALAAGWALIVGRPDAAPEDEFWVPLLKAPGKVIVCTGHPVVYRFTTEFLLHRGPADFLEKQTSVIELKPDEVLRAKDIVAIQNQYIGLGSAHASARIVAFLGQKGKHSDIRFGNDISFTDLRQAPAVLVSFANRWAFEVARDQPLAPELAADGRSRIVHRKTGQTWELPTLKDDGRTDEDYILITRIPASESGQAVIVVAGLTQYGTQAAGEIVSTPALLRDALAKLKPGWPGRSVQFLFHVRVVNHTPGPPRLLAVYEW